MVKRRRVLRGVEEMYCGALHRRECVLWHTLWVSKYVVVLFIEVVPALVVAGQERDGGRSGFSPTSLKRVLFLTRGHFRTW